MRVAMPGHRIGRFRRAVALGVTVLVAGALTPAVTATQADAQGRPAVQKAAKPVKGHQVKATPRRADPATRRHVPPKASWPKAGTADVTLPGTAAAPSAVVRAGKLPVWVGRPAVQARNAVPAPVPGQVKVRVLDHGTARRTGVNGLLLSVARTDTAQSTDRVGVHVDYSGFVNAFGGSYGSRLRLVQLPACALSTPDRPGCRQATAVPTRNNSETKALSADVNVAPASAGATVLAAVAGASSDKGDYTATSLSASATWQVGTQTGDFTWSYPMRVPPVPGDLAPKLAVTYDSGSVDGRTSNVNNQPSWVGEGFDLWSGYIERRYKSCADDGAPKDQYGNDPGDQCWGYDNATISFNGKAGELIPVGDGTWRMKDDDGTRIQKLTGADNGDNDGEYWKVTTTDGVQYFFGREPAVTGKPGTGSTWTVPVFGDDDTEPCHKDSGFPDSWCQQAWRWNLDYVLDPHGDAVLYYYTPETNRYARDLDPTHGTTYTRGGYLDHIEYGLRSDDLAAKPSARVNFGTSERCVPDANFDCDAGQIGSHPDYWWDVPWDENCADGTDCKDTDLNTIKASPTFWSRKRLTGVTTQILDPNGSGGYLDVDHWSLSQDWGLADVDRDLLLESIVHKGVYKGLTSTPNTEVTLPSVSFQHVQEENRVDKLGDDVGPYVKYRLGTIDDESGGQLDVHYSDPECTTDALPTPETNNKRCFPTYWVKPDGSKDPTLDWFHKYVVDQVVQTDLTGHAPDMVIDYDYQGGAAWHWDDDDGLTKEKYKTWSQWRGYGTVRVRSGGQNDLRTQTDHQYFRGMDGDRLNTDGGTKDVTVSDGEGGSYPDSAARQGFELKTTAYLNPGGAITSKTINTVWTHETAKRVRSWGTTTADLSGTASTRTLTALDGGNWRETLVKNTFDDTTGRPTQTDDQGDTSTADDDRCTTTSYATNAGAWMENYPSRVETVAVKCGDPVERPRQVISDARSSYDNGAFGDAPSKGDVTKVEKIADYNGSTPVYVTDTTTGYDTYGRKQTVTDAAGHVTTTTYTPATGLPTSMKVTGPPVTPGASPIVLSTSSTLDPAWSLPTAKTDAGGKTTILDYDALGRLIKVWLPNITKASGTLPSIAYTYVNDPDAPVAVETKSLRANVGQLTSYQIYDGFLRPRQTQAPGPNGSRLITDTFYDGQGKTARTYAAYQADGVPSATLFGIDTPGDVETQTAYTYDGLGRVTTETLLAGGGPGTEKWHTTTGYSGDRVTVTPPAGGTPTTTITNARGQTTEVRQYKSDTATGDYDATTYGYTPAGALKTVTDAAGNTWTHTYDLRGREYQSADPDKGTTTTTYNDLDQVVSTEDARGKKLFYVYDPIGRKTEEHADSLTGPLLTKWAYDTARPGQLASTTRYIGGAAYVATVNNYDNLNQPIRTTYTIPSVTGEEGLAGSYQYNFKYNLDESPKSTTFPQVAQATGMSAQTLSYLYDDLNRLLTTKGVSTSLVTDTTYSPTGQLQQLQFGDAPKRTWINYSYEYGTQRLHESQTAREGIAGTDRDATYGYADAGDVTSITDVSRAGTDNQCFRYDHLQRLTDAWTPTGACSDAPDKTTLGGPAPYWTSYGYDPTGNRTSETQHGVGAIAADTTRTYHYPDPGQGQHRLSSVTQTGAAGARTDNYDYDADGNTTTRDIGNAHQTLGWDTEDHLASTTDGSGTTNYAYDAGGNRLLRRDPTSTTVYLPDMELRLDKTTGKVTGTRYYHHGDLLVAVGDGTSIQFQSADPHGSAELSINGTTQALAQRRFTPFGQFRGSPTGIWPTDKGFVGGTIDPSGLTNLGARQYDPDTGRFVSVDPIFDQADPQSWNGYAYADDNPVTSSDPSGTMTDCATGAGGCGNTGKAGGSKTPGNCDNGQCDSLGTQSVNREIIAQPGNHFAWRPEPPRCDFSCFARNFTNGAIDGGLRAAADLALQVSGGQAGLDAACSLMSAKNGLCGNPADHIHVPLGGDVNDPGYKLGAGFGEYVLPLLVPGAGGEADAARGERGLPRLLKAFKKGGCNSCGCNSFVTGTQVLLANGEFKAIEDVKAGDKVLATDSKTGKTRSEPVLASFGGTDYDHLVQITVDTDRGNHAGIITATEHHKFWNPDRHRWTRADHLTAGTSLRTSDGKTAHVLRVANAPGHPAVRDLTITRVHTYYVLAGETPVLVHNSNCGIRSHDKARGASGVDEMTKTFEKFYNRSDIYSESYGNGFDLWTPYGRRQVDIAVRNPDGNLHLYEVKVNKSNYTRGQRRKDEWLAKTYGFEISVVRRGTVCPICNP